MHRIFRLQCQITDDLSAQMRLGRTLHNTFMVMKRLFVRKIRRCQHLTQQHHEFGLGSLPIRLIRTCRKIDNCLCGRVLSKSIDVRGFGRTACAEEHVASFAKRLYLIPFVADPQPAVTHPKSVGRKTALGPIDEHEIRRSNRATQVVVEFLTNANERIRLPYAEQGIYTVEHQSENRV